MLLICLLPLSLIRIVFITITAVGLIIINLLIPPKSKMLCQENKILSNGTELDWGESPYWMLVYP